MSVTAEPPAPPSWTGMVDRAIRLLNGPPRAWKAAVDALGFEGQTMLVAVLHQLMAEAASLAAYAEGRSRGWPHDTCVGCANRSRTRVRSALGYTHTPPQNIPEG